MNVRNFYIDADIEGRRTSLTGGPAGKHGGMDITITQRHGGGIETAVRIACVARPDGQLETRVHIGGKFVGEYVTQR